MVSGPGGGECGYAVVLGLEEVDGEALEIVDFDYVDVTGWSYVEVCDWVEDGDVVIE